MSQMEIQNAKTSSTMAELQEEPVIIVVQEPVEKGPTFEIPERIKRDAESALSVPAAQRCIENDKPRAESADETSCYEPNLPTKCDFEVPSSIASSHSTWSSLLFHSEATKQINEQVKQPPKSLPKLHQTRPTLEEEISLLKSKLEEATKSNSRIEKDLNRAQHRIQQYLRRPHPLHARVNWLNKELQESKSVENKLRGWNDLLSKQRFELQAKVNGYEEEAREAQERSFQRVSDSNWTPVPDKELRDRFDELQEDIRNFAKQYAVPQLQWNAFDSDDREEFLDYVSQVVRLTKKKNLPGELLSKKPELAKRTPYLLLIALLAREVQLKFFDRPFFCLSKKPEIEETEDHFINIHKLICHANPRDGNNWRAQVVRTLNPAKKSETKYVDVAKRTFARKRTQCHDIAKEFKQGPGKYLLIELEDKADRVKRSELLREIFMKAADLATGLLTQQSYIKCLGLQDFKDQEMKGQRFYVRSPFVEAHRLHRLDEDDHRLDGRPISIVVRPAIMAIGTHDGEDYDPGRPRVLAKAIVWLDT